MSRRHPRADNIYGALKIQCPSGHPLGVVWKQRGRYAHEPSLVRVDGPAGDTKLKARCAQCEAEGVYRDLQASWDRKLRPLLDEIEKDRREEARSYTLGE